MPESDLSTLTIPIIVAFAIKTFDGWIECDSRRTYARGIITPGKWHGIFQPTAKGGFENGNPIGLLLFWVFETVRCNESAKINIGHLYLGELYMNGGKKEKAIDNLQKAEGMFREMGMDSWLVKARAISETI